MALTHRTDPLHAVRERLRQVRRVIRLQPFDPTTPEGRSLERYRRAFWTTFAAALARAVAMLTTLVTVPLTKTYLGDERYGMWLTISSVIAMLGFADLGLGNGLLTAITRAHGRNDRDLARRCVSSAFFTLCVIAAGMAVLFTAVYPRVPWPAIFNVRTELARAEAGPAIAVFAALFFVNIPLGLVNRVQMGYQEGFVNSIWTAAGNLLGLGAVVTAVKLHASLPVLVLAMAGGPTFELLLNNLCLFGFKDRWLLPRWRAWSWTVARPMLHTGFYFMAIQLAVSLAITSDRIVASRLPEGAAAVPRYAVPYMMFSMVLMVLVMALSPLWPAYGEAVTRGDAGWVRKTLVRSTLLAGGVSAAAAAVLVPFGAPILHLWVHEVHPPSFLLLSGLAVWTILCAVGNAVAMFLNGVNAVRQQAVVALLFGVVGIALKYALSQWYGVAGIAWGNVLAFTAVSLVPQFFIVRRCLHAIARGHASPAAVPLEACL
jgi:O-antigen/teichoic acid export membrane protein